MKIYFELKISGSSNNSIKAFLLINQIRINSTLNAIKNRLMTTSIKKLIAYVYNAAPNKINLLLMT